MESEISLPEKILHLRAIQIFQDLSVSELAAVASVTEEVVYPAGEVVIREGEPGDTMYMIIKGRSLGDEEPARGGPRHTKSSLTASGPVTTSAKWPCSRMW